MEDDIFVLPQFHEIVSDDSYPDNSLNAENTGSNSNTVGETKQGASVHRKHLKRPCSAVNTLQEPEVDEDDPPELDDENEAAPLPKVRRARRKITKVADEPLDLKCEWRLCDFQSTWLPDFVLHVSNHIPHLRLRVNEENDEVYVCDWKGCDHETDDQKDIVRHVNFHSYHTKLKNIGSNLKNREKLTTCQYSSDNTNILPDFSEQLECLWDGCGREFTNITTFHYHIIAHVNNLPPGNNLRTPVNCEWPQCKKSFNSRHHLMNHMKKHTHSKVVGCPDCGSVFCSNTKFIDHCKRRISSEVQDYQCSHCNKFYSTERILRDHMISHINHCKCPFCDMTCPYEYTLATHIRNKHMNEKPIKCQMCNYRCKTQSDLKKHLNSHEPEPLKCLVMGCDFKCKRNITLQRHFAKVHCDEPFKRFDCHICHKQYNHGEVLTKHLIGKHDFHWPPGFSRFRYKQDEDGFYRLQTVRYESIEVTQAMLETESEAVSINDEDENQVKLGQIVKTENGFNVTLELVPKVEENKPDTALIAPTTNPPSVSHGERLIAIEELDDKGNIVSTSTVVEEISSLPTEGIKIVAAAGS